jgi:23S rRNA-/tRNA-specific pseudouridylate synthase
MITNCNNCRQKMVAVSDGEQLPDVRTRRAVSFADTAAFDGRLSVVQVRIETGRTHQIRVHMQVLTTTAVFTGAL